MSANFFSLLPKHFTKSEPSPFSAHLSPMASFSAFDPHTLKVFPLRSFNVSILVGPNPVVTSVTAITKNQVFFVTLPQFNTSLFIVVVDIFRERQPVVSNSLVGTFLI